jgi:hypothetical protein
MTDQIQIRETDRGWIASLPKRGLAAHALTREDAIRQVRRGAELVDRLSAQWSGKHIDSVRSLQD